MDLILVGLAAFFVFHALNHAPFLRPVLRLLTRVHPVLPKCPWCIGGWAALVLALLLVWPTTADRAVYAVVLGLAGACACGLIGTFVPDDGEVS